MKRATINTISDLIPDPKNANRGTKRGQRMIARSLREYGAGRSILLDKKGRIIAGNKTVENAAAAGITGVTLVPSDGSTIIAVQRTDLDLDLDLDLDPMAKALAIADNRAAEVNLAWDPAVLADISREVELSSFFSEPELEKLGVVVSDEAALAALAEQIAEAKLDAAEELQKKWQTASDQLWSIPSHSAHGGEHRLLCGDSTTEWHVAALMGTVRARMAFTDPPWNVAIGQSSNPSHRQRPGLQNDDLPDDQFAGFLRNFALQMERVVSGDIYVVMPCSEWPNVDRILRGSGLHWSGTIIWAKDTFVLGRAKYQHRFEPMWYGWPSRGKSSYCAGRDQDDVWEIARPKISEEHPTMKPPLLPARAISNSSRPGSIVYEPFSGSGTTICAAEITGRLCYAIEIAPKYVAVALERLADMGLKPRLPIAGPTTETDKAKRARRQPRETAAQPGRAGSHRDADLSPAS